MSIQVDLSKSFCGWRVLHFVDRLVGVEVWASSQTMTSDNMSHCLVVLQ